MFDKYLALARSCKILNGFLWETSQDLWFFSFAQDRVRDEAAAGDGDGLATPETTTPTATTTATAATTSYPTTRRSFTGVATADLPRGLPGKSRRGAKRLFLHFPPTFVFFCILRSLLRLTNRSLHPHPRRPKTWAGISDKTTRILKAKEYTEASDRMSWKCT